jgi:Plavaka transposase
MTTEDLEAIGQWRFSFPNFADYHPHCNIYGTINPDRLHQLLKGVLKDHTWKWVILDLEREAKEHTGKKKRMSSMR